MLNQRIELIKAITLTFKSKKCIAIAIVSTVVMLFLAMYIPLVTIPGNTLEIQFSLITWDSLLLILIFSILFGISIGMHSYAAGLNKSYKVSSATQGAGTSFASIIGTLFAGKLCPVCLSTIFGALGLGGSVALAVFSYRNEILIISLLFVSVSLYFAGKRINAICGQCGIK